MFVQNVGDYLPVNTADVLSEVNGSIQISVA